MEACVIEDLALKKRLSGSGPHAPGPCPRCQYDLRATQQHQSGAWVCPECGGTWTASAFVVHRERAAPPFLLNCAYVAISSVLTLGAIFAFEGWQLPLGVAGASFTTEAFFVYHRCKPEETPTLKLWQTAVTMLAIIVATILLVAGAIFVLLFISAPIC